MKESPPLLGLHFCYTLSSLTPDTGETHFNPTHRLNERSRRLAYRVTLFGRHYDGLGQSFGTSHALPT